ncbi:class I SAM-dependent methyltransferase [Fusobacterium hominis]|uniref:Class I SAM-dependent methyltransferase n=1 Tax=Fusobacterium hominis TaxID=2764326 RepID=A0A7G9GW67_9FUSO|nr:class I SAM-dependent methyltransferase [Fusobacterium hominis]QNM15049.1 class I SAM-dependent methyltransferase [Fusobacterium hominis]
MTVDFYNNNAENFFKDTVDADMKKAYDIFQKHLISNTGEILDLGCGSGRDSKYFIKCGYDITAIDLSIELAKKASTYLEKEVIVKDMRELDYCDKFIGIWACASLLHLKENDILKTLQKCYMALKKDGILYASFKYGNNNYEKDGRYFTCFTEEKIEKIVDLTNFIVVDMFQTSDVRVGREKEKWLNIVLKKG